MNDDEDDAIATEKRYYIHEQTELWKIHNVETYNITYWEFQQKNQHFCWQYSCYHAIMSN